MIKNVLLKIEYDGTRFSGWQKQPTERIVNDETVEIRTVQGEIERVLSVICKEPVKINGTSRTDAGVHALGQCASVKADFGIPLEKLPRAANSLLAETRHDVCGDVRILSAEEVPDGFHARFDCKGKKYIYRIICGTDGSAFLKNYRYFIAQDLDVEAMREAARLIVGTHDFKCFQAAGGEEKETTVRTVTDLRIIEENELPRGEEIGREIAIEITGDGFLYNMVRIITGTLVEVGLGKRKAEEIEGIIASGDRTKAGHTAPPEGLYLAEIYF